MTILDRMSRVLSEVTTSKPSNIEWTRSGNISHGKTIHGIYRMYHPAYPDKTYSVTYKKKGMRTRSQAVRRKVGGLNVSFFDTQQQAHDASDAHHHAASSPR